MKKTIMIFRNTVLLFVVLYCSGCNNPEQKNANIETLTHGVVRISIDNEIESMISPNVGLYSTTYPDAKITSNVASSRDVMAELFSGKSRAIIVARGYLRDEDSLISAHHIPSHKKFHIATDALVFFTRRDFVSDTLSKALLTSVFSNSGTLKTTMKQLPVEPTFYMPSLSSSVVANLINYCGNGKKLNTSVKVKYYSTSDSVRNLVLNDKNGIGIGYLSQIVNRQNELKMLAVCYEDSLGTSIRKKVHQSILYLNQYPYPVEIIGYLLEDIRNLPFGLLSFLAVEKVPQKSFLDAGIVPAFAKINVYEEE